MPNMNGALTSSPPHIFDEVPFYEMPPRFEHSTPNKYPIRVSALRILLKGFLALVKYEDALW